MRQILYFDIEISHICGLAWGTYKQDINVILQEQKLLSVAWSWDDEKKVYCISLPDFPGYKPGFFNLDDREITKAFSEIAGKAKVLVAHNGKAFDIKEVNTRMLVNGLKPLGDIHFIDTKSVAKTNFRFPNNKLETISQLLKVGRKMPNTGNDLWLGCYEGDQTKWKKMVKYNKNDVAILRPVYQKMAAWHRPLPNANHLQGKKLICRIPGCGGSSFKKDGFGYNQGTMYQRLRCATCGANNRGPNISIPKEDRPLVR